MSKPVRASSVLEQMINGATVLVDTREQNPLDIEAFRTERATLETGDYSIRGWHNLANPGICVERKECGDFISSLTGQRDRFRRELMRMKRFERAFIVVEAHEHEIRAGRYRSQATPQSMIASIAAIRARYNIHVIFAGDHETAARVVEELFRQYLKQITNQAKWLEAACKIEESPKADFARGGQN